MRRTTGLSLVELLLAMAIVGIVLSALLSLTVGTTRVMQTTSSTADVLRDLSDVTGYIGDNIRRARHVLPTATVNGESCAVTAALPCFALVIGDIEGTGNDINRYRFAAYRVVPRVSLPATFKADDAWADANTYAIVELRTVLCAPGPTPCSSATQLTGTTITGAESFLVFDGLSLTTAGLVTGTTQPPFTHVPDSNRVTVRLRAVQRIRGEVRHSPALPSAAHELEVVKRNN